MRASGVNACSAPQHVKSSSKCENHTQKAHSQGDDETNDTHDQGRHNDYLIDIHARLQLIDGDL